MNPDKLFDYLEGRLSPAERTALEQRLVSDTQLQKELAIAREIHARMHGDSREVLLPAEEKISERGRKLARRIGIAFIILMAVNVGIGLWFIARHESKNPNRALLEEQMRSQLSQSLEHAAAATLSPGSLGLTEITLAAAPGQLNAVADEVAALVHQLGGSVTKGIPEQRRVGLLLDLPAAQASEFRRRLVAIPGATASSLKFAGPETNSFAIEIVESTAPPK